jgi:membrane protease YdiL (CAAX protease family)
MTAYLITVIPQIIFIIWVLKIKNYSTAKAGLVKIKYSAIPAALFFAALLLLFSASFMAIYNMFFPPGGEISSVTASKEAAAMIRGKYSLIPLHLIVSVSTGYREEFFFRSYLLNAINSNGKYIVPVITSSLMFSVCHIYQGSAGIIFAFTGSIILSIIFLKNRNIHINALSHAFFNFFVIISYLFSA